jgi:branched-chain amino acid transport system ATP-binding protein
MTAPLLTVAGLDAWYGRAHILAGVNLEIGRGEVVALVGRNGAGKSTVLKSIIGLVPARRGRIVFDGLDIGDGAAPAIARAGVGYVPEDRRIFTDLSVLENLEVGRQPPRPGLRPWTVGRIFALFPALEEMRQRRAGRMSGGEQQMLTLARTLMGNPALLLLDEPSEGLAPRVVRQMADTVAALKAEGLSVLLSEQNLSFAGAVADRASVIETGRICFDGTMAALLADESLRRAHLAV